MLIIESKVIESCDEVVLVLEPLMNYSSKTAVICPFAEGVVDVRRAATVVYSCLDAPF